MWCRSPCSNISGAAMSASSCIHCSFVALCSRPWKNAPYAGHCHVEMICLSWRKEVSAEYNYTLDHSGAAYVWVVVAVQAPLRLLHLLSKLTLSSDMIESGIKKEGLVMLLQQKSTVTALRGLLQWDSLELRSVISALPRWWNNSHRLIWSIRMF